MMTKVCVRKDQRGLLFRDGDLVKLLQPGTYRMWPRLPGMRKLRIEFVDISNTIFAHKRIDFLIDLPELRAALEILDLKDDQRALVWRDDRLFCILGPGRYGLWKQPYQLRVEIQDASVVRIKSPNLNILLSAPGAREEILAIDVDNGEEVLVFSEGQLIDQVGPGRYAYWLRNRRLTWKSVDLRRRSLDVSGQEIMTKDKVTLRINLLVAYRVVDSVQALTVAADYEQALYREAQLALRAQVGTRTLENLLESKESLGEEITQIITARAAVWGLELNSVGLKDIILPGDMKAILNQVILAEKEAQANIIRRREETAAARSQANTAKLLADNPVLAKMKELEMVQAIVSGAKANFVFGEGSLIKSLRSIVDSEN